MNRSRPSTAPAVSTCCITWRCGSTTCNLEAARVDLASLRQSTDVARKRHAVARPQTDRRPASLEPTERRSDPWDHPLADVAEGVLWVLGQLF